MLRTLCILGSGCHNNFLLSVMKFWRFCSSRSQTESSSTMPRILRAKCVVIGDSTVGKSALTQVVTRDHFPKNYAMTIGVDLQMKPVVLQQANEAVTVELYIFDCSGKDAFADDVKQYVKEPSVFCIVFDLTDKSTFDSCKTWLENVKNQSSEGKAPGILIGNKSDLKERRVVMEKEAKAFADKAGLKYFECSAKETKGVEEAFNSLATSYLHQFPE